MMLKLLLVDDMKTERISETEVLGKANDLQGHSLFPQQNPSFPKECPCMKAGTATQVVSDPALGMGTSQEALLE